MDEYVNCLSQYAKFTGRTSRREYWMFILFDFIFTIVFLILGNVIGIPIALFYSVAVLVPRLAATVRRLHDIGWGGSALFFILLPVIGGFLILVLTTWDSVPGSNEYGENPKLERNEDMVDKLLNKE